MPDELVDVYDENNEKTGTLLRSVAQSQGQWIRSFHCWLVDRDSRSIIFQKRASNKRVYPDCWDISAAGHYVSGEALSDGPRELEEELGLVRRIDDLHFLGIRTEAAKIGDAVVREFAYTYLLVESLPPDALNPDEVELAGITYVPIAAGLRIFSGDIMDTEVTSFFPIEGSWKRTTDRFAATGVIPRKDPYYLKIFMMAERALDGNFLLAV